jgi:AcrR family transcriptional regulator
VGTDVATRLGDEVVEIDDRANPGQPDLIVPAEHGGPYEVWIRDRPATRRPRFNRDDIADAALRVVDAEGIDALSMRRLAAELGAGTMTLYHYVKTKDELFALLVDRVMSELILADDEFPTEDWRAAMTAIARRTREVMSRHPWVFDIAVDPAVGPNGVRHFDQSLQALAGLDLDLGQRMDILFAVDEYTFGHCLHGRTDPAQEAGDETWEAMSRYVVELASALNLPAVSALIDEYGVEQLWQAMRDYEADENRFQRNLDRLLDGIERDLAARGKTKPKG